MHPYKTSIRVENKKIINTDHHTKEVEVKELDENSTQEEILAAFEVFCAEMHVKLMQSQAFNHLKTFKKG